MNVSDRRFARRECLRGNRWRFRISQRSRHQGISYWRHVRIHHFTMYWRQCCRTFGNLQCRARADENNLSKWTDIDLPRHAITKPAKPVTRIQPKMPCHGFATEQPSCGWVRIGSRVSTACLCELKRKRWEIVRRTGKCICAQELIRNIAKP